MRHLAGSVLATALMLAPAHALAQADIAGVVRDTSGAVLPGVTVEASSPALIEKARTVVTDGSGQYRIVDLRPGSYVVTFTLTDFATVRREGIELAGSGTVVVNGEMRVGALEETVTVTGEAATVDVQTVTRQQVLSHQVIDAIPTGRNYYSLGVLIPGVSSNAADVGGSTGDAMAQLSVHGSRPSSQRITQNGVSVSGLAGSGGFAGTVPNVSAAAEVTVDTNAVSAELATGGVRVNFIPRDGGNRLSGSLFASLAHEDFLVGSNFTERLKTRGLTAAGAVKKNWDFAPGVGGPIQRDRLWYYFTARYNGAQNYAAGMFENRNAWDPSKWTYEADTNKPALSDDGDWEAGKIRLTWQASAKHKIAGEWDQERFCRCPNGVSATTAPEAGRDRRFPTEHILMAEWSSPLTSRLLAEVVALHRTTGWGENHRQPSGSLDDPAALSAYPRMISVLEQSTGLRYRSAMAYPNAQFNKAFNANYFYRGAVSYITGSHAVKVGFNNTQGYLRDYRYDFQPISYRFSNGVPNQIQLNATPFEDRATEDADLGVYAQDRWTIRRFTLSGGVRFDYFKTSFPEITVGPGPLVPNRNITFPAQDNLGWKDVTPRMGVSYDVSGDGRTAVKVTLNKYLEGQALGVTSLAGTPSPFRTLVLNTTRSWTDTNRNYVADCNLAAPGASGECGPMANQNFGGTARGATFDPELLRGWGNRFYNWEFSASVQRELVPRLSVEVGYFRRWFGNFQVTDNVALAASDFNRFSIAAPLDSRLPGGGGYTVDGLYNVTPSKFGQELLYNTLSDDYGKQREQWNGLDLAVQLRPARGAMFSGGVSTGKRMTDNCEIVATVPETLLGAQNLTAANANVWLPAGWCHQEEPFRTQVKGFGSYTVPRIDVQISGTFQSIPGELVAANYVATNAVVAPSLGRPLAGRAANMTVNIVEPGSLFGERLSQLDLRFGKQLRFGRSRSVVSLDVYNVFNSDTVLTVNSNFAAWQRPQTIVQARFAKIALQLDF